MDQSQLVKQIGELLKKIAIFLLRFVRRQAIPLIGSAVFILLVWQGWQAYSDLRAEDLTHKSSGILPTMAQQFCWA